MGFSSSSSSDSTKQNSGVNIGKTSGNGKVILFPNAVATGANGSTSSSSSTGGGFNFNLSLPGVPGMGGGSSPAAAASPSAPAAGGDPSAPENAVKLQNLWLCVNTGAHASAPMFCPQPFVLLI